MTSNDKSNFIRIRARFFHHSHHFLPEKTAVDVALIPFRQSRGGLAFLLEVVKGSSKKLVQSSSNAAISDESRLQSNFVPGSCSHAPF